MKILARKIKELRLGMGLRQHEFANKIDASQSSVSKWETGKDMPDRENIVKIANLAGQTPSEFMGLSSPTSSTGRKVYVCGELAAGRWVEAIEWPEEDKYEVSVALPENLSSVPLQGFVVRGDSMDRRYPDGSIVYVAPIRSVPGAPKNGDDVMVMRFDSSGTVEGTLKEYCLDINNKAWLWPRSTSPEHQAPLEYEKKRRGIIEEVRITGVVMAALVFSRRIT